MCFREPVDDAVGGARNRFCRGRDKRYSGEAFEVVVWEGVCPYNDWCYSPYLPLFQLEQVLVSGSLTFLASKANKNGTQKGKTTEKGTDSTCLCSSNLSYPRPAC